MSLLHRYSEKLRMLNKHEDTLTDVVREQKRAVEKHEKELQRIQAISNDDIKLHPVLCNFKTTLNIQFIR